MAIISQEIFIDWKNHVVTQELFKQLNEDIQNIQDSWSDGEYIHDPILNARNIGTVQVIKALLKFNPVILDEDNKEANNE